MLERQEVRKEEGSQGSRFKSALRAKIELIQTQMTQKPMLRAEIELELIQTQMAQKPMLRAEVGMRVRCANKASAE